MPKPPLMPPIEDAKVAVEWITLGVTVLCALFVLGLLALFVVAGKSVCH